MCDHVCQLVANALILCGYVCVCVSVCTCEMNREKEGEVGMCCVYVCCIQ